ncbi:TetR family transcriptional regulator [Pseudarthrobacter psychrotolerans]|uniref:TetR family transcriptional regulator n=1 Tax=Pseudarthrobacter psychrotolerans TaxID=2697569 RepID=A0A6P1NLQ4_9MICC|nr:TetR/AcrR family transcriptional regulator [Pseudarthrobacter psychrotolerans]QHK20228.1 TetR family transcriptional regulator [Pseudarthrobacter psychrotolerans]
MPKLWNETIESHRDAVRAAILDATASLVADRGLAPVTMSQIAQAAGIGRATLYKYFPDVEAILTAWHERQINSHLEYLSQVRNRTVGPGQQVESVLEAYAFLSHSGPGTADFARLHQGPHVGLAQQHLRGFLADLLRQGADAGRFRRDVAPDELAAFCLHALEAASALTSRDAVLRLVKVTMTALQPPPPPHSGSGGSGS